MCSVSTRSRLLRFCTGLFTLRSIDEGSLLLGKPAVPQVKLINAWRLAAISAGVLTVIWRSLTSALAVVI